MNANNIMIMIIMTGVHFLNNFSRFFLENTEMIYHYYWHTDWKDCPANDSVASGPLKRVIQWIESL